jgi:methionyl-tRNA formyltransferase
MWSDKQIALLGVQEQCLSIGEFLLGEGYKIAEVVTVASSPAISGWVDIADWCRERGISVYEAQSYSLKSDVAHFQEQQFDVGILLGWQRLIPDSVIETFKHGIVGQHGSSFRLPRGRGRSPINWSLIEGRDRLIWHLFELAPGVDDGDILDVFEFDLTEHDTCKSVYDKLTYVLEAMLKRTLPRIFESSLQKEKQLGEPSYYPKRTPEDGWIDWNANCDQIYNLVRAVTKPYPGARAKIGAKDFLVWRCSIWSRELQVLYPDASTGDVVIEMADGFVIRCGDGLIFVGREDVKPLIEGS